MNALWSQAICCMSDVLTSPNLNNSVLTVRAVTQTSIMYRLAQLQKYRYYRTYLYMGDIDIVLCQ